MSCTPNAARQRCCSTTSAATSCTPAVPSRRPRRCTSRSPALAPPSARTPLRPPSCARTFSAASSVSCPPRCGGVSAWGRWAGRERDIPEPRTLAFGLSIVVAIVGGLVGAVLWREAYLSRPQPAGHPLASVADLQSLCGEPRLFYPGAAPLSP